MTRTIIIPLADPAQDQAGIAEQAITCTRMLTGPHDARVLLLSVIDDEATRAERGAYLEQIAGTIAGDAVTVVERGEPAAAILAVAGRESDPRIIMASHGRRGARLRLLGSVAASVARDARCPVMILPASPVTHEPICKRIERVLLPMNDAGVVDALIDAALAELGAVRARDIEFHLVEVAIPVPPQPAVTDGERFVDAHEVPAHFLRRAAEIMQSRGYRATWDVRIGDPSHEIARIVAEKDIHLIVMPAHSRHGFNSLIPTIFAAQVETAGPVPVLLVHPAMSPAEDRAPSRLRRATRD
jgi:nucleotide-binding universal stress UspA family protein